MLRGQLVSKVFWTPVVGEILQVASEEENMHDKFAVALSSAEVGMVGHVPRECFIAEPSPCRSKSVLQFHRRCCHSLPSTAVLSGSAPLYRVLSHTRMRLKMAT